MKTFRILPLFLLLVSIQVLQGQPIVRSSFAPNKSNENYGENTLDIKVTYGKTDDSEMKISPDSISTSNIRVVITNASNPNYQDWEYSVESVVINEGQHTLEATYTVTMWDQWLSQDFNGTWTVFLNESAVYNEPDPDDNFNFQYVPAGEITTFTVNITVNPSITIKGRLWLETGNPSLTDDTHSVDPGIEDWGIAVERESADGWWQGLDYYVGTDAAGNYVATGLVPGLYRIGPQDIVPEFATQAIGDPSRDDVVDGYFYIQLTLADDGQEKTVHLPWLDETDPPNVEHDEYLVGFGAVDKVLRVLDNDDPGLEIIGLSDYQTTVDFGGTDATGSRGSRIWTDGSVIYYTPVWYGWEIFWYKVKDANDNTDLTRVWIFVDVIVAETFKAYNDTEHVNVDSANNPITVLDNDSILSPHEESSTTLSINSSTTSKGGSLSQIGHHIHYTPPAGFLGDDFFEYTITSGGESSSAFVTIKVMDPSEEVPNRLDALMYALAQILKTTPEGMHYLQLAQQYLPELASMIKENSVANRSSDDEIWAALSGAITPFSESLTRGLIKSVADPYVEGLSLYLSGEGDNFVYTTEMASDAEMILDLLESTGSDDLKATIQSERAKVGSMQQFVGKTIDEISVEVVDVDPASVFVQAIEPHFQNDVFTVKAFHSEGQEFKLLKADDAENPIWQEVTQTDPTIDDRYIILEDSNTPHPTNLYRITVEPEPGSGGNSSSADK